MRLNSLIVFGLTLLTLAGCGHNVCIAGIRQCKEMFEGTAKPKGSGTTTQRGTDNSLFAEPAEVEVNPLSSTPVDIGGGTPPYTCSIQPMETNICDSGACKFEKISETRCMFKAGSLAGTVPLSVKDGRNVEVPFLIRIK